MNTSKNRIKALAAGVIMSAAMTVAGCMPSAALAAPPVNPESENLQQGEKTQPEGETLPENAQDSVMGYENKLFDNSYVHTIDVIIDENDWEDLKKNATSKTKYNVDLVIDGETIENVSFAAKGNSSLSSVSSSGSKRFSFKINFGKFIDDQTYYGLNKLSLSNMYLDATYMKDYLAYSVFTAAGVPAPLTSYVSLSINGELFGLYLAIEDMSGSFRERALNDEGELYKPEGSENAAFFGGGGGQSPGGSQGQAPAPGQNGGNRARRAQGVSSAGDGTDLKYIDDSIESYAAIFDNNETKVTEKDMKKVIAALKALSEGNPEEAFDTEEVIRYFAAHNFMVNYDSMTSNRTHNYYLYENHGKLALLPWDYNESIGAHGQAAQPSVVVNSAIDTPLSGPTEADRPAWSWIVSDDAYLERYHEVLGELMEDYFFSGQCTEEINRVYEMIRPYVENDPTAFYTVEEFDKAHESLVAFCELRAQSIQKQLDGTLAARTDEQKPEDLVDASSVSITDMGGK